MLTITAGKPLTYVDSWSFATQCGHFIQLPVFVFCFCFVFLLKAFYQKTIYTTRANPQAKKEPHSGHQLAVESC